MATTEERIAQLAQGFGQGVQNFQQGQDRQRQQSMQDEARRRQEAMQAIDIANTLGAQQGRMIDPSAIQPLLQSGNLQGIGELMQAAPVSDKFKAEQARLGQEQQLKDLQTQKLQEDLRQSSLPFEQTKEGRKFYAQNAIDSEKMRREESKKMKELEVPGFGVTRTAKEAADIRASMADANDAVMLIDKLRNIGEGITVFDRKKIGEIDSLKKILAGKLRLPLTGPGAMTEDEFKRLIDTMGDPSSLTSTENIENAKLDQLKEILQQSVVSKFNAASGGQQVADVFNTRGAQGADQSQQRITDRNNPAVMNSIQNAGQRAVNTAAPAAMANDAMMLVEPQRVKFRQNRLQELRQKAGAR